MTGPADLEPVTLAYVGYHWGDAYLLARRGGRYEATRKDDRAATLSAGTAEELLEQIRADYARRPVPRPRRGQP